MKILQVLNGLDQNDGGPLRGVLDISFAAKEFGIQSEILGFGPINIPDNPMRPEDFHAFFGLRCGRNGKSFPLQSWLEEHLNEFDGVILNGMWKYQYRAIARACLAAGVPYACFPHGMLDQWPIYGQGQLKKLKKTAYWMLVERSIFESAEAILFTTRREMQRSLTTLPFSPKRCVLTPFTAHIPARETIDDSANDEAPYMKKKCALFLGRLHPKKGLTLLLSAWSAAKMPQSWHLVIAGPGETSYVKELKKKTQELGITHSVSFVGAVAGAQKRRLFRTAKWFVLPSYQENLGIAVIEALLSGCPVAISDQVYVADLLHRDTIILPLSLEAWTNFLQTTLQDDDLREQIALLDASCMPALFDIRHSAKQWAGLVTTVFRLKADRFREEAVIAL